MSTGLFVTGPKVTALLACPRPDTGAGVALGKVDFDSGC
jgi:hypothetical protein